MGRGGKKKKGREDACIASSKVGKQAPKKGGKEEPRPALTTAEEKRGKRQNGICASAQGGRMWKTGTVRRLTREKKKKKRERDSSRDGALRVHTDREEKKEGKETAAKT